MIIGEYRELLKENSLFENIVFAALWLASAAAIFWFGASIAKTIVFLIKKAVDLA